MTRNKQTNEFEPDFVHHPGETLAEIIESEGMTQQELAERLGMSRKTVNSIVQGKARILADTAIRLERVLGTPASFWLNLQQARDEYESRQRELEEAAASAEWAANFDYPALVRNGFVPPAKGKIERARNLLCFFRLATHSAWDNYKARIAVNFRRSLFVRHDEYALAAWLRQGEIAAARMSCPEYSQKRFKAALHECRKMTVLPAESFWTALPDTCCMAGVKVVFVPELPKAPSGAARWLDSSPVIQLSLRYKRNDSLWFSFFHEAAHVLYKHKPDVSFIESSEATEQSLEDSEADAWASEFLIPRKLYEVWASKRDFSRSSVTSFADQIGIHPAIVVGRCLHDKLISYNSPLTNLRETLEWSCRTAAPR